MSSVVNQLHAWSRDALLAKAQRYVEQMLELPRDDWRFVLWSTLALELLARAAVAHISPTLLADAKDRNNLIYALGIAPKANRFVARSIDITEVFTRLKELVPGFAEIEGLCSIHMARRNEELHSGDTSLDGVANSSWLPAFYRACEVLLGSMNESFAAFLGGQEAIVARQLIDAFLNQSAQAVQKSVVAHQTVWNGKTAAERDQLAKQASLWATRQGGHRVVCPSCRCDALVEGSPIAAPLKKFVADVVTETQEYLPSRFECIACGLRVAGLPQLSACGLGDSFKATLEYDATDYFAQNDPMRGYEPDYNEP